jgi:transglutaminase-like putative cysteine protease
MTFFLLQISPALADTSLVTLTNDSSGSYYVLENDVTIVNTGSDQCTKLQLEVPLMAKLDSPYQQMVSEDFSVQPSAIKETDNGNRTGTFNFDQLAPGAKTVLVEKYTVKVNGSDWLQASNGQVLNDTSAYLQAAPKIESSDPRIQAIANIITSRISGTSALDTARAAFDFTRSTLTYNLASPAANQGALAALQNGSGVCQEFASLFVAICRAAGIPARIVNGYANDRNELAQDNTLINIAGQRHQWAEFYLKGKGWIPADPTMSNAQNSMFGELPAGSYVAENYGDVPVKGTYYGGHLNISFEDQVARGQ